MVEDKIVCVSGQAWYREHSWGDLSVFMSYQLREPNEMTAFRTLCLW